MKTPMKYRILNQIIMKRSMNSYFKSTIWLGMICLMVMVACEDEDDAIAITNDLRVLKVNVNGDRADEGASDI